MTVYDDVFAALGAAKVRFVVVGGLAVLLRGHARLTVDLDLVIDLRAQQATAAIEALLSVGLVPRPPVDAREFADPSIRADWVANRNMQVFSMHDPNNALREVDLFATDPVPFDELEAEASAVAVGHNTVQVASVRHLIAMKQASGRPQDLEDVAALRALYDPPNAGRGHE
jgi:hypothetical protein